jgi:hypothetical protein
LHWESFGHAPALELDLRTLRAHGASADADELHGSLQELTGRKLKTEFPSLALEVALVEWEAGARDLVAGYVSARDGVAD